MGLASDAGLEITRSRLGALPDWVLPLAELRPSYAFAPCDVFRGRAVAAVRMTPGTGAHVVITDNEDEMRAALGVPMSGD
jgi:hypothetical protein